MLKPRFARLRRRGAAPSNTARMRSLNWRAKPHRLHRATASGAAEGFVARRDLARRGFGIALPAGALVERMGDHLEQPVERRQIALVGCGGERFFDAVIARNVQWVDAVHGSPPLISRTRFPLRASAPALEPGRGRGGVRE